MARRGPGGQTSSGRVRRHACVDIRFARYEIVRARGIDTCADVRVDTPRRRACGPPVAVKLRVWINDAGHRSYYCGLTMLVTVHIIVD